MYLWEGPLPGLFRGPVPSAVSGPVRTVFGEEVEEATGGVHAARRVEEIHGALQMLQQKRP